MLILELVNPNVVFIREDGLSLDPASINSLFNDFLGVNDNVRRCRRLAGNLVGIDGHGDLRGDKLLEFAAKAITNYKMPFEIGDTGYDPKDFPVSQPLNSFEGSITSIKWVLIRNQLIR